MNERILQGCLVGLLLGSVLALGCGGGGDSEGPAIYRVTGTVTLNNQPVDGATLNFLAADGSASAVAVTGPDGTYSLKGRWGEGAVPGDYKVGIVQYEKKAVAAPVGGGDADDGTPGEGYVAPEEGDEEAAPPKNLLPTQYAAPATSGFTATVTEDEDKNKFDFNLEG